MNVAFFGTSDKSVPILESLKHNFELVLCITKSDSKFGRKQRLKPSKVKLWAIENEIDFLEIDSIKNSEKQIIKSLENKRVQIGIVADFSFIIPQSIINTPNYKLINIHFSLLPKMRGASPVQYAIYSGLNETGITFYIMDKNMDTGDIIYQEATEILNTDTSESLYLKMFEQAASTLPRVISSYVEGNLKPAQQNNSEATYCRWPTNSNNTLIDKQDAFIDWAEKTEIIDRKIRAFYPWPIAWTYLKNLENNNKLPEKYVLKDSKKGDFKLKIYEAALENGFMVPRRVQLQGKNITDWKSFVNGYLVKA